MTKTALYDNPAGYGHGGLGYHHTLDELPTRGRAPGEVPAWLPWVGLAGAGVLGYGALRGLGKAFRRGAKAAPKAIDPAAAYEREMLGRVNPKFERMGTDAAESMAQQQARMLHEESLKPLMKGASLIPALGRIARGA